MSTTSDSRYVLKRLKNPRNLRRFEAEVAALRKLEHENIASLRDYTLEDEQPWFVADYYEGGSLEDWVTSGRADRELAFELFDNVCAALEFAHDNGLVHRDLKPANILLRSPTGPAVLGDFGLCWLQDSGQTRITLTEEQVGSRFYMAPELRDGRLEKPTYQCDVYSLGKVLYFMMTGRVFDRENFRDDQWNMVVSLSNFYLEHVNNLLDKSIAFDPNQRSKVKDIRSEARQAARLIRNGNPSLDGAKYAPCGYCGIGSYQPQLVDESGRGVFFGLQVTAMGRQEGWRALVCDHCGNVQLFRTDLASKDWFPKGGK